MEQYDLEPFLRSALFRTNGYRHQNGVIRYVAGSLKLSLLLIRDTVRASVGSRISLLLEYWSFGVVQEACNNVLDAGRLARVYRTALTLSRQSFVVCCRETAKLSHGEFAAALYSFLEHVADVCIRPRQIDWSAGSCCSPALSPFHIILCGRSYWSVAEQAALTKLICICCLAIPA